MQIHFHGAAGTVTGSMHRIVAGGAEVLLDCGLFQGRRQEAYDRNRSFPFVPGDIRSVVLSHAHADHAGNLPNLVSQGFSGPIVSTSATRDLCQVTLFDSAFIHERDVEIINKVHAKQHLPPVVALYGREDVARTMESFTSVPYHKPSHLADDLELTFVDAGHILGSACCILEHRTNGRPIRLGFTGDLGRRDMPILRDPEPMGDVDVLICESTYGGRVHEPRDGMKERLTGVLQRTFDRGGKVVVPAFSLGRTQEFVYILFELFDEGRLPSVPIFVDSPLAVNATEVFRLHSECFDPETLDHLLHHEDPFRFGRLRYIRSVEESKQLNDLKEPCIIISASGMCEAGRILHHLANTIGDPKHTVLFISYQAEHTLGRKILDGAEEVRILGSVFRRKAEVAKLNAFSAHAGQDEIVSYVRTMDPSRLKQIYLVHGEPAQASALAAKLNAAGYPNVHIPERGDSVEVA